MTVADEIVLSVNAGSSSLRLAVYACGERPVRLAAQRYDDMRLDDGQQCLRDFLQDHAISQIARVAHRVVHGGNTLVTPCVLDTRVEAEIERLSPLAPLHNPVALAWIRICRAALGAGVPQVAVFDTAFFADLPEVARIYALPRAMVDRHNLRRYGFHGIAHRAMWRHWRALRPEIPGGGRVISLQLGSGCSITAIRDGRPLDTSMGFSPLEGLVMATRSGDVDPGLLLYLQRAEGMSPERLEKLLNEESGLFGVSGMSGDMRVLLDAAEPKAGLAVEIYCQRVRKYIGAYLAVLGGADAILFGGGVGENAPPIRARILEGMAWAGIELDTDRNRFATGTAAALHGRNSSTEIHAVPVDEAAILAEEALALIAVHPLT